MREEITSSSPPHDVARKTGKLHLLMDASYCLPWARDLHIIERKTNRKLKKTPTNRNQKVRLIADTFILQNTKD